MTIFLAWYHLQGGTAYKNVSRELEKVSRTSNICFVSVLLLATENCFQCRKAPVNEETLFSGMFLGRANERETNGFLSGLPKKPFTGNQHLSMLNLGNTAYATTESSPTLFPQRADGEKFVAETKCF